MSVYRQKTKGRMAASFKPSVQPVTVPACVGGINSLDSLAGMPPTDCLYTYNLMPSEYGMRLRQGYREYATVLSNKSVNTVIPYEGVVPGVSDRLWAVTEDGIYNVSVEGSKVDTPIVPFDDQAEGAGFGVWTEFTNDATDNFLQYADGVNGLWEYEEETDAWDRPGITGPEVEDIAFVTTWKNRIWYIEENKADAWYLAPDSNSGQCTKFTFGSKFDHGGDLRALYSWTIDGGDGIDDMLVAVSSGGDVLIYKGFDPAIAPEAGGLSLVGSYFIGEVPYSRRLGASHGGDLFLLSTYGLVSIRDLLQGVGVAENNAQSPSAKINRFLRQDVIDLKGYRAWAVNVHPADGFLQIVRPYPDSEFWVNDRDRALQYTQNLLTKGWGIWQQVPVQSAATWKAGYYIGDQDGRVWSYTGSRDRTTFDSDDLYDNIGDTSGQDGWTKNNDNDFTLVSDDGLSALSIQQPFTTVPGTRYLVKYEIYDWVAGRHGVSVGTQSPLVSEPDAGDGFYQQEIVADVADNSVAAIGFSSQSEPDPAFSVRNIEVFELAYEGDPIPYSILTSFQAMGQHGQFKQVGLIRTVGVAGGTQALATKAVYDYDIQAQLYAFGAQSDYNRALWDINEWNRSIWDDTITGKSNIQGSSGMGRTVAIAARGESDVRITIVAWDLMFTQGGLL